MILLSPNDIERMKEINKKLQGKRLAGGPVDDIGPLDIKVKKLAEKNNCTPEVIYDLFKVFDEILKETYNQTWEEHNADKESN